MEKSTNQDTLKKYLIGIVITVLASSVFAATGWNFKKTSEIAEKYVSKEDFAKFTEHNNKEHEAIQLKLDKIYDKILEFHAVRYGE